MSIGLGDLFFLTFALEFLVVGRARHFYPLLFGTWWKHLHFSDVVAGSRLASGEFSGLFSLFATITVPCLFFGAWSTHLVAVSAMSA